MCLDLVLERQESFLLQIFVKTSVAMKVVHIEALLESSLIMSTELGHGRKILTLK